MSGDAKSALTNKRGHRGSHRNREALGLPFTLPSVGAVGTTVHPAFLQASPKRWLVGQTNSTASQRRGGLGLICH